MPTPFVCLRNVAALVFIAIPLALSAEEKPNEPNLAPLQGSWTAIEAESGGTLIEDAAFWREKKTFKLTDADFKLVLADGTFDGSIRINSEVNPKQITFVTKRDMELRGIYALSNDQLTLCWAIWIEDKQTPERPIGFATRKGEFKFVFKKDAESNRDKTETKPAATSANEANPPKKGEKASEKGEKATLEKNMTGMFRVVAVEKKGGQRRDSYMNFWDDGNIKYDGKVLGTWAVEGKAIKVDFAAEKDGTAIINPVAKAPSRGIQTKANGDTCVLTMERVLAVSTWEITAGNGGPHRHTFWATGRLGLPDGKTTWRIDKGKVIMVWPDGAKDTCNIAPDGRSFEGRNQFGTLVRGKLVEE